MGHGRRMEDPPPQLVEVGGEPVEFAGGWRWYFGAGRVLIVRRDGERELDTVILSPAGAGVDVDRGRMTLASAAALLTPPAAAAPAPPSPDPAEPFAEVQFATCMVRFAGAAPPYLVTCEDFATNDIIMGWASRVWWPVAVVRQIDRLRRLEPVESVRNARIRIEEEIWWALGMALSSDAPSAGRWAVREILRSALGVEANALVPDDSPPWRAAAALDCETLRWIAEHQRGALGDSVQLGWPPFLQTHNAYVAWTPGRDAWVAHAYVYRVPAPDRVVEGDIAVGAAEARVLKAALVIDGVLSEPGDEQAKARRRREWAGIDAFVLGRTRDLQGWLHSRARELVSMPEGPPWLEVCKAEAAAAIDQGGE